MTNNDSDDLLFLGPDKMGMGLFHYFTNGLTLRDKLNNRYTHSVSHIKPESSKSWKNEWLSEIKGDETIDFSIIYNDFAEFESGTFKTEFTFPDLSFHVDRSELIQSNGRIWLGNIEVKETVEL